MHVAGGDGSLISLAMCAECLVEMPGPRRWCMLVCTSGHERLRVEGSTVLERSS